MFTNTTKAKLQSGETVFGVFVRYPDAALVEVLGYQGWDFIVFDGEHGTISTRDCENMTRAAECRNTTPFIRVPNFQPSTILQYMDVGPHGLHVPWVNTADQAERVVQSVKYQPRGIRGLANVRASGYGQAGPLGEYIEKANTETLVAIHIETAEAVDNLAEIVKVDGLDVIFIGPTDLSHSLGVAGQLQHPRLQEAMDQIVDVVKGSPPALGLMVPNAEAAQKWQERGARYITINTESLMCPAMKDYLRAVKG